MAGHVGECWLLHVPQTLPLRTHEHTLRRSPGKGNLRSGENPPTNSDGIPLLVEPKPRNDPTSRRILLGPHRAAAENRPHLARPDADRRGPAPGCQALTARCPR